MAGAIHESAGATTLSLAQLGALYQPAAEAAGDVPEQDVLLSRAMKHSGMLKLPSEAEEGS